MKNNNELKIQFHYDYRLDLINKYKIPYDHYRYIDLKFRLFRLKMPFFKIYNLKKYNIIFIKKYQKFNKNIKYDTKKNKKLIIF